MASKVHVQSRTFPPLSTHHHGLPLHISKLGRSQPSSPFPNSLHHGLQVYLQTRSILACKFAQLWPPKCICTVATWQPPSAYLQTHSIMASKCISRLARLRSVCLHDHGLQLNLHVCSITTSEWICKFTRSRPPTASPNPIDYCFQVHFQTSSITASECTSEFTESSFSGAPWIGSETPPAASPDIPCVDG